MKRIHAWGKKIGMTQFFVGDKVVPVTAIDVAHWLITALKSKERDGYDAVQIGLPKKRYASQAFEADWLKQPNKYFYVFREVRLQQPMELTVGQPAQLSTFFAQGDILDVSGENKGCGFQGVIKRHDFNGPPGSHGSTMGKRPGAMSFMRSRGRVIKGKRLPGQMGGELINVKNLEIVKIEQDAHVILVKGSIPGRTGTLISMRKA